MSEDKRQNARTQGRYSGGEKEYSSRRQDKQSSKMPSADKNKGEKRNALSVGSRVKNEMDLQYEEGSKYSFKDLEPVRKPQEIRFNYQYPVHVLSKTENGESRVIYDSDFMKTAEADEYMTILEGSTAWHDKNIVIKGIEYPQPRLVAWYGPHPYTYAGATLEARDMPFVIREIKENVETNLKKYGIKIELNSVLLNLYRNEKDSVAWHSDDELSLGVCPTIASISLGATRKFEIRPKLHVKDLDANDILYVNLTNGSLIVMDGCMQRDWQHRVPKEFHDRGPRINLTFRTIYPFDQLPPEMPRLSNMNSASSPVTKEVLQQDLKLDPESFPPLGIGARDQRSKLLQQEKGAKDYQQPLVQRRSQKEENWGDEILQSVESSEETQKAHNNINKNSSYPIINLSEFQSSQIDFNSNIEGSSKSYNSKLSPKEYIKSEYHSDSSKSYQSHNFEQILANKLESIDLSDDGNPVKIKAEPVEVNARPTNSGKKYMLNADAPDFVPKNKFEKFSLLELAQYCRCSENVRSEDLQTLMDLIVKCVRINQSLFINRDFYEFEVYDKLNDGSLSDKHFKIILERISSMVLNAYYKNGLRPNNRYSNADHKPRQTYSRSPRY